MIDKYLIYETIFIKSFINNFKNNIYNTKQYLLNLGWFKFYLIELRIFSYSKQF